MHQVQIVGGEVRVFAHEVAQAVQIALRFAVALIERDLAVVGLHGTGTAVRTAKGSAIPSATGAEAGLLSALLPTALLALSWLLAALLTAGLLTTGLLTAGLLSAGLLSVSVLSLGVALSRLLAGLLTGLLTLTSGLIAVAAVLVALLDG